jgi:hypothetical protein
LLYSCRIRRVTALTPRRFFLLMSRTPPWLVGLVDPETVVGLRIETFVC